MIYKYLVTILSVTFLGCSNGSQLGRSDVIGEFINIDGADHYSRLSILEDDTYSFEQAINYGDVWAISYGFWKLDNEFLRLYKGVDIEPHIKIEEVVNLTTDTLIVTFEEDFIRLFPDLAVRIGLDSADFKIDKNKIIFDKYEYCKENNIIGYPTLDIKQTYQYYPLDMYIRSGQYFSRISYILSKSQIIFGAGDFVKHPSTFTEVIAYSKLDTILVSTDEIDWILPHLLVNMSE